MTQKEKIKFLISHGWVSVGTEDYWQDNSKTPINDTENGIRID